MFVRLQELDLAVEDFSSLVKLVSRNIGYETRPIIWHTNVAIENIEPVYDRLACIRGQNLSCLGNVVWGILKRPFERPDGLDPTISRTQLG